MFKMPAVSDGVTNLLDDVVDNDDSTTRLVVVNRVRRWLCVGVVLFVSLFVVLAILRPFSPDVVPSAVLRMTSSSVNATFVPDDVRQRLPDVIIIGVRKGGTRALLRFVAMHPDVQAHRGSELHFFDNGDHFAHGARWYVSRMPFTTRGQLTIEKTPGYFHEPTVPARVKKMLPNARFLLVVRDPVTRAISDYAQIAAQRAFRGKPSDKFEELVLNENGQIDRNYNAIYIGLYHKHMRRWLHVFDRHRFHIVDGEMLIRDPIVELRKVESYLGLRKYFTNEMFVFDEGKGFFCPVEGGRKRCLGKTKGREHPQVDPNIIKKMRHFYSAKNSRFCNLVAMNFSWC